MARCLFWQVPPADRHPGLLTARQGVLSCFFSALIVSYFIPFLLCFCLNFVAAAYGRGLWQDSCGKGAGIHMGKKEKKSMAKYRPLAVGAGFGSLFAGKISAVFGLNRAFAC